MPLRSFWFVIYALLLVANAGNSLAAVLPAIPAAPEVDARNYILIDPASGQILAERTPDQQVPPASLTKLMTAYLTFQAIARGSLRLNQTVPVSVKAWKIGGSTMFLQPDLPVTVEQIIRGMAVVSGNDASIAAAEAVAGNTDSFVQMMNATARQLGLTRTHFDNVDGLPTPTHLMSARDVGLLTEAIVREYPQYVPYFKEQTFTYNGVTQRNWNPLVFSDPTVTGMKTGHTKEAGYCLAATAIRNGRPLIAVVLGASSRNASGEAAQALLSYGYRFFETRRAYRSGQEITQLPEVRSSPRLIPLGPASDVWITVPIGRYAALKPTLSVSAELPLPLTKGQTVGTVILSENGREVVRVPVVALKAAEKAGWLTRWWNTLQSKF